MSDVTQALTMSIIFIVCSLAGAVALGGVGVMLVRRSRAAAQEVAGETPSQGLMWLGFILIALVMGLSMGVFGWLSATP